MNNANNHDNMGEFLSTLLGGMTAAGIVGVVIKTILLTAIAAAVGGIVGFYVNRLLHKIHSDDDNESN